MLPIFLVTLFFTLPAVAGFVLLLNYCRRRLRKTPHGLSGMCHQDGGKLCASCQDKSEHTG